MPQKDKQSTLLRQWEMMRMLTVSRSDSQQDGRWDKASDITAKLSDAGYDVSMRTVQRDLKELSEIFPIELNDKNARDYGWRWIKGANLDIPGMSATEALAIRLVETHLVQLLPSSMLESLQGVFALAHTRLDSIAQTGHRQAKDWLKKVRVVSPAQPLIPPDVNETMQDLLYQALLHNRQITAHYHPANSDHPKEYILHPLGLIARGPVVYLVASAWHYDDVHLYALHRFKLIEILGENARVPPAFDLDEAIANGLADFADRGESIELELRCTASVATFLAETPLASNQTLVLEPDGWTRLTATVNNTWQLHWWLLGQGQGLEVCKPTALRENIRTELENTLNLYGASHC